MMKLRLAKPDYVIDIDPLAGALGYIAEHADHVRIGAMTRHNALLESATLERRLPIFTDAERVIADPVVRNRGTIGGALCQADPSEDLCAVCAAVGARLVIRNRTGERVVDMDEFHRGPYETAVGPAEMLTEIRVPTRPRSGSAYVKVDRRVGDWAVVAAGAALQFAGRRDRRGRDRARRRRRGHHAPARPRPRSSGEPPSDASSPARRRSLRPHANRSRTNADPRTTNGTSSASSRSASSDAPPSAHNR